MKKTGYLIFAWIYNICSLLCPAKKKKIVLFNGHNHGLNGNLLEIYQVMQKQDAEYQFVIMAKRDLLSAAGKKRIQKVWHLLCGAAAFFVVLPYHMATAQKVFFNDNFLPLVYMRTSGKNTQFVQLWHGAGAFKRFGLSTEKNPEVYRQVEQANQNITHLFVTSRQVVPYYQEAFSIPEERIYPTGIPVTDLYFDEERIQKRTDALYQKYPYFKGKKLLLYAPTFRTEGQENAKILEQFDVKKIHAILGEEWLILIKMHPKFPVENITENKYCYNMTDYNDISDLYLVADLLITDYSSSVVEFVLLDKPILFFAYDLPKYDRGFYFDYEKNVPGKVAHDQEELYHILSNKYNELEKRQDFAKFQYDNINGGACERILDILK